MAGKRCELVRDKFTMLRLASGSLEQTTLAYVACFLASCSELGQLRQEIEQLRQQLQHQQELLLIWQQQPCTLCQLHSTHASTNSSSRQSRTIPNRSTSSRSSAQLAQDSSACRNDSSSSSSETSGCCQAVQCRLDRALRQQQVQLAQLQKQVLVLQVDKAAGQQQLPSV
jgi:hypothetical protein